MIIIIGNSNTVNIKNENNPSKNNSYTINSNMYLNMLIKLALITIPVNFIFDINVIVNIFI
ncbi:hypothetical protein J2127_001568 [Methanococcus voltae]|nr:hypothetical protein [Methanococcus voltae]